MQEKGNPILIGNMYRPPDSRVEYNDRLEEFIDNVLQECKEIILLGDFNKNLLPGTANNEWENFMLSLGLSQMISEPTRVTNSSSTLIDHIYTSYEENISSVRVCKLTINENYAVFGNRKIKFSINKTSHQMTTYRSFIDFDENAFVNDLHQIPWEIVDTFDDVNDMVQIWNSLFLEVVDNHAPVKHHRVKKYRQSDWLFPEILDAIKDRKSAK